MALGAQIRITGEDGAKQYNEVTTAVGYACSSDARVHFGLRALSDGQLSMEEHRTRVATATTAATLGDLQALVDDLQTENAPVQMPDLKKPSPFANRAGHGGGGVGGG